MVIEAQLVQVLGVAVYEFLWRCFAGKKVQLSRKDEGRVFSITISGWSGVMIQIFEGVVKAEFEPIVLAAVEVSSIDGEIERILNLLNKKTQYVKEESEHRVVYSFSFG